MRLLDLKICDVTHFVTHPSKSRKKGSLKSFKRPLKPLYSLSPRLAGVEGLEPPAPGFGDRCSTS